MSSFRTAAAVAVLAGASLLLTGCAPAGEANSRKVIEALLAEDVEPVLELMTENEQYHAQRLTSAEMLGSYEMVDCELGKASGTQTDDEGLTEHLFPMDCGDHKFLMKVAVTEDNLVDDIDYDVTERPNA